jgi:hypothetical protein
MSGSRMRVTGKLLAPSSWSGRRPWEQGMLRRLEALLVLLGSLTLLVFTWWGIARVLQLL